MSNITVGIEGLAGAIEEVLQEYDDTVKKMTPQAVRRTATKCRNQIRAAAPGNDYPNTWATRTTKKGAENFEITVYSKKPGLPHLLEHGHVLISHGKVCGRTGAKVHIKPAELQAIRDIEQEILKRL